MEGLIYRSCQPGAVFMKKILPLIIDGEVGHFSVWMTKQLAIRRMKWGEFNEKIYKVVYTNEAHKDKQDAWVVFSFLALSGGEFALGRKWATILAVEDFPGKTTVEFIDGLYYCHNLRPGDPNSRDIMEYDYGEQIGDNFVIIAQEIKDTYLGEYGKSDQKEASLEPWEKIPNTGWDREVVRLWHEQLSAGQIGNKLGREAQTIRNRIAQLRGLYGEEIVPYRRK